MKKLFLYLLSALATACSCGHAVSENTVEKEAVNPLDHPDTIVILDLKRFNLPGGSSGAAVRDMWDNIQAAACVQGIVNRTAPLLYLKYIDCEGTDIDSYWLNKNRGTGKWLDGKKFIELKDVKNAIKYFKPLIKGLVVWDPAVPSTSNVAATVAGVEDLIAVRYDSSPKSMYHKLLDMGFEVKVRLLNEDGTSKFHGKTEPYRWAVNNYLKTGRCSTEYAAYYIDAYWLDHYDATVTNHHCLTNHDFFIGRKAFFFDLSPWGDEAATDDASSTAGEDLAMLKEILHEIYVRNGNGSKFCHIGGFPAWAFKYTSYGNVGGKHDPVPTEWEFSRVISAYNAFKDADAIGYGAMANASFWSHYPLESCYPQEKASLEDLKSKGYIKADGKVDTSRKYFVFYVGDYDASSWLYQKMPQFWNDEKRGSVPLMWAISPVLSVRAPMVMDYIRKNASANDYFVAADNGAGYMNPGMLEEPRGISGLPSGLDQWAEHCKPFYQRFGLTITGFIIDGYAPKMSAAGLECYSKFSPDGIVEQMLDSNATIYDGMPVLKSGPDINDGDSSTAASKLLDNLGTHPEFPFYWARAILKTPTWYCEVKAAVEKGSPETVWLNGAEFFLLLKTYLEERQ